MRRALLAAGAAAAIVLLLGVAQGWWRGGSGARPSEPLVATTSLSARTLAFGDPLTARVDVLADPRAVDPASIRVRPRFAPYLIVGSALGTRSSGGVLRSYRFSLECLGPACVPGRTRVERQFLPAVVTYRARSGKAGRRTAEWPSLTVVSRLSDVDRAAPEERLRVDAALPAVSYHVDPGLLRALLIGLAAGLVLLAAALVALALRRPAPAPVEGPSLSPLEQALLLVHVSSSNGFPEERRRALGRLARELSASGRAELAGGAADLAWSAAAPSGPAAKAFAAQVESSLEETT